MGNQLNCTQTEKMRRKKPMRKAKRNLQRAHNGLKKNSHSSTDIIPHERETLLLEKPTDKLNVFKTQSKSVCVWICRNRQLDQRIEISLGSSPCFNVLIEKIKEYFDGITEDTIILTLLNDDKWSEIAISNVNTPLTDVGINHHSTISIEENTPMNDDISDLSPESNEKRYLTVKAISSNWQIQIEYNKNTTLAMLEEKIRSECGSDFQIDYLQISIPSQSLALLEENRTPSSLSISSTPVVPSNQNKNLKTLVKTDGHYGLRNLGNTCFMNSALQSLSNVQPLTDHFLINEHIVGDLAEAYHDFIEHIWKYGQLYNPKSIRTYMCYYASQFDNFEQHDAHEFLIFLLDQLHQELKDEEHDSSIISTLFKCQIDTITTCLTCKKTRQTPNSMNFIPLSLDNEKKKRRFRIHFESIEISVETDANGFIHDLVNEFLDELKKQKSYSTEVSFQRLKVISTNTNEEFVFETSLNDVLDSDLKFIINDEILRDINNHKNSMELSDCLDEFIALETPNYQWFCKMECNQPVYTAKRMLLSFLSPVLIIQLKRFTETNGFMQKLDTFIKFPINELDLKRFMIDQKDPMLYDLIAVVNHIGNIHRGHYTTYARQLNDLSTEWFCFNDDQVTPIDQSRVVSDSAYILIYVKRQ